MQHLSSWFSTNKCVINTDKTTAMCFHAWQNKSYLKSEIIFQEMDIGYRKETKFLELYLTEDIKLGMHIQHLSKILNKNCYVLQ